MVKRFGLRHAKSMPSVKIEQLAQVMRWVFFVLFFFCEKI